MYPSLKLFSGAVGRGGVVVAVCVVAVSGVAVGGVVALFSEF